MLANAVNVNTRFICASYWFLLDSTWNKNNKKTSQTRFLYLFSAGTVIWEWWWRTSCLACGRIWVSSFSGQKGNSDPHRQKRALQGHFFRTMQIYVFISLFLLFWRIKTVIIYELTYVCICSEVLPFTLVKLSFPKPSCVLNRPKPHTYKSVL